MRELLDHISLVTRKDRRSGHIELQDDTDWIKCCTLMEAERDG